MSKTSDSIKIDNLSHEGKGVGRQEADSQGRGKACFVAGALPGETVLWRRTQIKRSFDEGELVEVIYPSPDRVTPKCQYIGECGGCELQHMDPNAQLEAKQQQLKQTFAREGIEPQSPESWLPPLAGNPWEYRRRTRLAVAYAGNTAIVGYRQRSSRKIVPIVSCVVLEPALNELIPQLSKLISDLKNAGLSQIELTLGESEDDVQAALCLSVKTSPDAASLKPLTVFCEEHSLQLWVREGKKPAEPQGDYPPLQAKLGSGLDMQFTPAQFVQTNAEMNRKMIEQAMWLLDVQPDSKALDLFCGAGNFSLPIAKRSKTMLGIEGLSNLIVQADMNAARQQLSGAEFKVADLSKEDALSGKNYTKGSFDRILLDPPRTGAKNLMPALVRIAAPRLVYISCHPATMVRDAKILIDGGYKLTQIGVVDMFPQTTHLEAMALFER